MDWKKRPGLMSDEKRKPLHPETNFLPPLKMFLAFNDQDSHSDEKKAEKQEGSDEKNIEKLIEKLSEKDE